jgi:hypothetical protein
MVDTTVIFEQETIDAYEVRETRAGTVIGY